MQPLRALGMFLPSSLLCQLDTCQRCPDLPYSATSSADVSLLATCVHAPPLLVARHRYIGSRLFVHVGPAPCTTYSSGSHAVDPTCQPSPPVADSSATVSTPIASMAPTLMIAGRARPPIGVCALLHPGLWSTPTSHGRSPFPSRRDCTHGQTWLLCIDYIVFQRAAPLR